MGYRQNHVVSYHIHIILCNRAKATVFKKDVKGQKIEINIQISFLDDLFGIIFMFICYFSQLNFDRKISANRKYSLSTK